MPGPGTTSVHGADPDGEGQGRNGPVSGSLDRSSIWRFEGLSDLQAASRGERGGFYGRYGNLNYARVERVHAALHGAEDSCLFASGVGALAAALLGLLSSGDTLVVQRQVYGGSRALFGELRSRLGIHIREWDMEQPERLGDLLAGAQLLFIESPTNPFLRLVDLPAISKRAHAAGVRVLLDSTFQGPTQLRPLALGVDLIVESATKSLGGHSDILAGLVAGRRQDLEPIRRARRLWGAIADPQAAWLLERSLKTLPLRARQQAESAEQLARRLAADPRVAMVSHPSLASHPEHDLALRLATQSAASGGVGMVTFRLKGGERAARSLVEGVRVFSHAASLGGVESLICLPAFTSHSLLSAQERVVEGIGPDLVRLSLGVEEVQDLWADLHGALS